MEDLGFERPVVGGLYVNTGNDRMFWVYWYVPNTDFGRVPIQYLDNGRRTKMDISRWDLRRHSGSRSYPRAVRVHRDVLIKNLKVPYLHWEERCR